MSITKILFSASNLLHKYNKIVTQKNQTDYLHEESLVIKLNGMKYVVLKNIKIRVFGDEKTLSSFNVFLHLHLKK